MSIDYALRSFLLSHPDIVATVEDRVSPGNLLPQSRTELTNKMPQIVTNDKDDTSHYHSNCGPTPYHPYRYRLISWGVSKYDVNRLDKLIRQVLDGYAGPMANLEIGFTEKLSTTTKYVPQLELWRAISEYQTHVMNDGINNGGF